MIEKIIESEFNILEKVDKVEEQDANRFGYGALHYLVKLGKNTSGARYDDLKEFICEIQVRTVLQDAWAIIAHHLSYKKESDVPGVLRRKLNSLAGLFETADDQFDRIREKRDKYRQAVVKKLKIHRTRLRESANIDSLTELLKLQYPDLKIETRKGQLEHVLCRANKYGYFSLEDVRSLLKRTDEARDYFAKECPRKSGAGEIARAIAFDAPESRHLGGWSKSSICLFKDLQNKVLKKMRRTKHPTNVL